MAKVVPQNEGMDTFAWIKYRGKEILSIELPRGPEKEADLVLERFIRELLKKRAGTVLLLADLSHAGFWPTAALNWQNEQGLIHSKCAKLAVVGAHGIISIAARTFLSLAKTAGLEIGSKVRFFENSDEAKKWLIQAEEKK